VQAAWLTEPSARGRLGIDQVVDNLAADLGRMASWLELDRVVLGAEVRGDLVRPLDAHLSRTSRRPAG
jgi:uncharacterized protein YcaQ